MKQSAGYRLIAFATLIALVLSMVAIGEIEDIKRKTVAIHTKNAAIESKLQSKADKTEQGGKTEQAELRNKIETIETDIDFISDYVCMIIEFYRLDSAEMQERWEKDRGP